MNPESLINPVMVFTRGDYEDMLIALEPHRRIQFDIETVGKTTLPLFHEQEALEEKMAKMEGASQEDREDFFARLEDFNSQKQTLKDTEAYLKQAYKMKSFALTGLNPTDREKVRAMRAYVKAMTDENQDCVEYNKLVKSWNSIQKKIDEDKSGLHRHSNMIGMVQVGTTRLADGLTQYFIDPDLIDEDFVKFLTTRSIIIGTNLKFDLVNIGFHKGIVFDRAKTTLIDIHLIEKVLHSNKKYIELVDENGEVKSHLNKGFALKDMSLRYLGYEQSKEERISNWKNRPLKDEQIRYGALDVINPFLIYEKQRELVKAAELEDAAKLQLDFLKVLTRIELNGLYVNLEKTRELVTLLIEDLNERRIKLAEELGDTLEVDENGNLKKDEEGHYRLVYSSDLQSPAKTLELLQKYGQKHDIPELMKLKSTSSGTLEDLDEMEGLENVSIGREVAEFKSIKNTVNKYCRYFLEKHVDSRIYTTFTQLQKEGTRASSKDPNIQNLPQPGALQEPGKDPKPGQALIIWNDTKDKILEYDFSTWTAKQRVRTLTEAPPGKKMYDADYSGIELRMMAYITQDPLMLKSFQEDLDLHSLSAINLFGLECDLKDVKKLFPKERNIGKTFNFSVGYGCGWQKLQGLLIEAGIRDKDEYEIRGLIEKWFATYAGVKSWQDYILHQACHEGYCETRLGRKIYYPEPTKIYNKAFNTPIQASCYEGLQLAGILLQNRIIELEDAGKIKEGAIKIVNYIHDEFLVEADANLNEKSMTTLISNAMVEAFQPLMEEQEVDGQIIQRVPVKADAAMIRCWAEKG